MSDHLPIYHVYLINYNFINLIIHYWIRLEIMVFHQFINNNIIIKKIIHYPILVSIYMESNYIAFN
jgi:hypothetical protein